MEELQKELDRLIIDECGLFERLSENRVKQRKIKIDLYTIESGLSIGDDVLVQGKKGKITNMDVRYSRVEPYIKQYKKDGTLGTRRLWVWNELDIQKV